MNAAAWLIVAKVVGVALLVGAVVTGVRSCQEHYRDEGRTEVQSKWDNAKREDQRLAEKARSAKQTAERGKEQGMARKAEENARAQAKRDQDLQRRSADLQRSDDGMRGAITSANSASTGRRAAGTCPAADAEADDAATARALLGTCTGRYRAMAEDAAGLATQVTDLQDHVVVVQPEAAALLEEAP